MKKIAFYIVTIVVLFALTACAFATEIQDSNSNDEKIYITTSSHSAESQNVSEEELSGASEDVIGAMTRKDERIKVLSQKFNDKTLGTIAYWLEVVRFYSTPIFFIFLTIGAFNFFIIGNKKLDKKEQGFGWITACIIGWVVFQCIPLVFTLITLGTTK